MTILTLDELVTPQGLEPFLKAFAAKTSWHLPVNRPAEVEELLPWTGIESLIANSLVPLDRFRIVVNGNELPPSVYSDESGRLRADAVQRVASEGATLAISDIGALLPTIGELAAAIERDLRCRIGVNCYITFGELSAFIPHCDAHDVLVLQIHGAKNWRSFGAPMAFPVRGNRPSVAEPIWEKPMSPGDLLYLPRGEVHAAIPQTRPSVHLTIGIYEPTGVDFLQWMATKAADVVALRRDLGATLTGQDRSLRDREFADALRALLDGATVADFLKEQDRDRSLRPLAALSACQSGWLQAETKLISALRRRVDLAVDREGELLLTLGKRQVRLAQLSRRALAEITANPCITIADLASRLSLESGDPALALCLEDLAAKSLIAIAAG